MKGISPPKSIIANTIILEVGTRMIKKTSLFALLASFLMLLPGTHATVSADEAMVAKGKQVALDRRKGNCLACHMMDNGPLPGNQGPPLLAMKARFPDRAKLREQVANPLTFNPFSIMPPFGLHNIISDDEIDAIVEYLYTL